MLYLHEVLETKLDHNYSILDGLGQHVFEFVRVDGSRMRLHYHKNGKSDKPVHVSADATYLPGLLQAEVAAGGAAQPAGVATDGTARIFTQEDLQNVAQKRQGIGAAEASRALQILLHYHHGP